MRGKDITRSCKFCAVSEIRIQDVVDLVGDKVFEINRGIVGGKDIKLWGNVENFWLQASEEIEGFMEGSDERCNFLKLMLEMPKNQSKNLKFHQLKKILFYQVIEQPPKKRKISARKNQFSFNCHSIKLPHLYKNASYCERTGGAEKKSIISYSNTNNI